MMGTREEDSGELILRQLMEFEEALPQYVSEEMQAEVCLLTGFDLHTLAKWPCFVQVLQVASRAGQDRLSCGLLPQK